ncbi:MAG: GNAT family protein [Actinomycetaceae bacterium]|nr:GNAT family protein [Actinomycetaceae bacterium]MDO5746979.1 GNAT family protein [Actinomycetaceae bacterium]
MYPGSLIVRTYDWWTRYRYLDICAVETGALQRGLVGREVDELCVRQMRFGDYFALDNIRRRNHEWLQPWDATAPSDYPTFVPTTCELAWQQAKDIRYGRTVPLIIEVDGQPVGQITVLGITRAAAHYAMLGYWIDRQWANCGVMTAALAMTMDVCMTDLQLHRIEINIRPDNRRSLRVVEKLGLSYEGHRKKFLHVNNEWYDHECFAITAEVYPQRGLVAELERIRGE